MCDETIPREKEGGSSMQSTGELKRNVVVPHKRPSAPQDELQESAQPPWWKDGVRLMADGNGKGGLIIPYPLLAIFVPVVIALIAFMGAMYSSINSLNNTMLIRDAQHQQEIREVKEKLEQQAVYFHNDRERIGKLEAQSGLRRRDN